MLYNNLIVRSILLFISIAVIISFTSCSDDDPLSAEEEHFEAIGTAIYDATGALTLSILRGETEDTLYVDAGELSDHFTVKFYDEDENIVDPPEEEHTSMDYEVADGTILEIWQHPGEEGGFEFHLQGLSQGITTMEMLVKHEGHNDYRSGNIPVVVR